MCDQEVGPLKRSLVSQFRFLATENISSVDVIKATIGSGRYRGNRMHGFTFAEKAKAVDTLLDWFEAAKGPQEKLVVASALRLLMFEVRKPRVRGKKLTNLSD